MFDPQTTTTMTKRSEQQELTPSRQDMQRMKRTADQKIEQIIRKQYAEALQSNNEPGIAKAKSQADLMGFKLN